MKAIRAVFPMVAIIPLEKSIRNLWLTLTEVIQDNTYVLNEV
jgi:hypothetical protein